MSDRERAAFIPAMSFGFLSRIYDPAVSLTSRERAFRSALLDLLDPQPGERILDLGAGTGTFALMIATREPAAVVDGCDADPDILERAMAKAVEAGAEIDFRQGFAQELPYEDGAFAAVASSLFFHHLTSDVKEKALAEVRRVLVPGGRVCVADWGKPADPLMAAASVPLRLFDGLEPTADNFAGRLPGMFAAAGFEDVTEGPSFRTMLGSLRTFSARR